MGQSRQLCELFGVLALVVQVPVQQNSTAQTAGGFDRQLNAVYADQHTLQHVSAYRHGLAFSTVAQDKAKLRARMHARQDQSFPVSNE